MHFPIGSHYACARTLRLATNSKAGEPTRGLKGECRQGHSTLGRVYDSVCSYLSFESTRWLLNCTKSGISPPCKDVQLFQIAAAGCHKLHEWCLAKSRLQFDSACASTSYYFKNPKPKPRRQLRAVRTAGHRQRGSLPRRVSMPPKPIPMHSGVVNCDLQLFAELRQSYNTAIFQKIWK